MTPISTLQSPPNAWSNAPTSQLRAAYISTPTSTTSGGPAFAAALMSARDEMTSEEKRRAEAKRQVPHIMKLLMLLELTGGTVPKWMIETLKAAGMEDLALSLEKKNEDIERGRTIGQTSATEPQAESRL